jgi:inner membrane protein
MTKETIMATERPNGQTGQTEEATSRSISAPRMGFMEIVSNSQVIKVLMIFFLTLMLQIPIKMIDNTIGERQQRNYNAEMEVSAKWGREQTLIGPILTIPYERDVKRMVQGDNGLEEKIVSVQTEYGHFLPENLNVHAKTDHSVRHRGIFNVPVFRLDLAIDGNFTHPDFTEFANKPDRILWEKATLTMLIADSRTITSHAVLSWNDKELDFKPGTGTQAIAGNGIHLSLKDQIAKGENYTFTSRLTLQGSRSLTFAPVGGATAATVEANWPDPSFQGNWLPTERTVSDHGFTANWQVASLGRNFPQRWVSNGEILSEIRSNLFGVAFISPVNTYSMAERSVKYQFLFLALTFITLWLFEVLGGARLHLLHYLLVGAGMCLFYLLLLSLSEHLSFLIAYLISALAIILMQAGYCAAILGSTRRALIVGGFVTLLYSYLYTLLINQDYALLAGSIGLFLLLATVMYLTRKIDWRQVSLPDPTPTKQAG